MAASVEQQRVPAQDSSDRLGGLKKRFEELRDCQARYTDFTVNLFEQFEQIGGALLAKETALDGSRARAEQHRAEQYMREAQQALAEMESLRSRLSDVEFQLQSTRAELEQERQCTASEKASLDDETREFLDDLVHERDALRGKLETLQVLADEQKSGYESEIELLRNQLHDASQVNKLRCQSERVAIDSRGSGESTEFRGDVSRRAEDIQAPCDTAETSPNHSPSPARPSTAATDLESLMNQVRLLQQDVARRRNNRNK